MEKQEIKDKKLPVGFTFSFPCRQSKLDEVSVHCNFIPMRRERRKPTYTIEHNDTVLSTVAFAKLLPSKWVGLQAPTFLASVTIGWR